MYLRVVAIDLDGTVAMHDRVASSVWKVLREIKRSGRSILLVTGRRLEAIEQLGPFEDLCEAIVAEDGASVYFPSNQSVLLPFGHLSADLIQKLYSLRIPLEKGMAIVATTMPYNHLVMEAIGGAEHAATIEYNKGAVMILPPGATKGTGMLIALHELGFSPHNVVAFGDAENDRSLFEQAEVAVAVQNADNAIKELADIVLSEPNGKGVSDFLHTLVTSGNIPQMRFREKRNIVIGKKEDGTLMTLDSLMLTLKNVGIFGTSGSGKSWLAGLIAEKLFRLEYQICIIDPEGDYRGLKAFPNTLLLGGENTAPPQNAVVSTLLEYSDMSLVIDLSQYTHEEKQSYVVDLMKTLLNLRERRGKPHWFLIDEAHYFFKKGFDIDWADRMKEGGFTLLSYRPSEIDDSIIQHLDHLMITHLDDNSEGEKAITTVCRDAFNPAIREKLQGLTERQVYFFIRNNTTECVVNQGVMEMESTPRKVPHIRHLHKYLRAPLPSDKRFYFQQKNGAKIPSASSLHDFMRILPRVPDETLAYHLNRGDFESWIFSTLHDEELARRIRKIANRHLNKEYLKQALTDAVSSRYEELELLV